MSKPERSNVANGQNGWDAAVNANFQRIMDGPIPIFLWTGDESDLASGLPPTSYDECFVWVDHTAIGLTLYHGKSDHASGSTAWMPVETGRPARVVTGNASANIEDRIIIVNSAGAATLTLRPAADLGGNLLFVKTVGAGAIGLSASSQIDGSSTYSLSPQFASVILYSDGSTYHVVAQPGSGGGGGSSVPNYSTSEQLSGNLWHDGKVIYQKTIVIATLPNATLGQTAHGISNLNELVHIQATAKRSSSFNLVKIPNVSDQNVTTQLQISIDATNINLRSGSDYSAYSGAVTLFYTKTV